MRESEELYLKLFEVENDAIILLDQETRCLLDANVGAQKMYGYSLNEFTQLTAEDITAEPEKTRQFIDSRNYRLSERLHRKKDGTTFPVEITGSSFIYHGCDMHVATMRDISERKRAEYLVKARLRIISAASVKSSKELMQMTLDEIESLTSSVIGFYHFLLKDQETLSLQTWSTNTLQNMCISEGESSHYPISLAGVWVDCIHERRPVIHNDYESLPHRKGLPPGHALIVRELVVPVIRGEHIVAIIGVGNKPSDYDANDIEIISHLGDFSWEIIERKQADEDLRASEKQYRELFNNAEIGIFRSRLDGSEVLDVNRKFLDIVGSTREETIGKPSTIFWEDPKEREKMVQRLLADGRVSEYECRMLNQHGGVRNCLTSLVLNQEQGIVEGTIIDITESKRAEEEKDKLEAQLQQAQKMESVGRLAGGVAHDFNNLLVVILGFAELATMKLDPAHPLQVNLAQIRRAAERAADLTRQLLAFARKQTIAPKVLNLNESVAGMINILQRLVGENIRLTWQPAGDLWKVKADPSQIDQILANLCVNARDAIADIGEIAIETGNASFDKHQSTYYDDSFVPGDYVRLAVSDNGCGMNKETLMKVFEPFFTTKVMGKGTGLGLSTVYGAVKQNGGFIDVQSEPDMGTTVTVYLPRHVGKSEQAQMEEKIRPMQRGQETILLVEDDLDVLDLTTMMLKTLGYTVMSASTPGEAISMARENLGEINLLITDVIMPEMNVRDMTQKLLFLYPHLKCLFMSGYTNDIIANHGVLDESVNFIQKPFKLDDLADKVREVLDSE